MYTRPQRCLRKHPFCIFHHAHIASTFKPRIVLPSITVRTLTGSRNQHERDDRTALGRALQRHGPRASTSNSSTISRKSFKDSSENDVSNFVDLLGDTAREATPNLRFHIPNARSSKYDSKYERTLSLQNSRQSSLLRETNGRPKYEATDRLLSGASIKRLARFSREEHPDFRNREFQNRFELHGVVPSSRFKQQDRGNFGVLEDDPSTSFLDTGSSIRDRFRRGELVNQAKEDENRKNKKTAEPEGEFVPESKNFRRDAFIDYEAQRAGLVKDPLQSTQEVDFKSRRKRSVVGQFANTLDLGDYHAQEVTNAREAIVENSTSNLRTRLQVMAARPKDKSDWNESAEGIFDKAITDTGAQTDIPSPASSNEHDDDGQAFIPQGSDDIEGLAPSDLAQKSYDIKPGSLIEIKEPGRLPHVALTILKGDPTNVELYVLTSGGNMVLVKSSKILFIIPNFVESNEVEAFVQETKERGEVAKDLTLPMIKKLREFESDANSLAMIHQADFGGMHGLLSRSEKGVLISTFDVAKLVFGENPTSAQLYATHVALIVRPRLFLTDQRLHRNTFLWWVRPSSVVQRNDKVHQWIRDWIESPEDGSNPIGPFLDKCKLVIDDVRAWRQESDFIKAREQGSVITENDVRPDLTWTLNEIQILETLLFAIKERQSEGAESKGLFPHLLNSLDRYKDRHFTIPCLAAFLGDVGAITPWASYHMGGVNNGIHMLESDYSVERAFEQTVDASQRSGFNMPAQPDLNLTDSFASMRHDWGDLPVYCIDSDSTTEVDDGLSIESVPGSRDVWIRIHVANPTAFISRDHWLAESARIRMATFYGPQRTLTMLPPIISQDVCSLGPNKPCLTFSVQVDLDTGEMKDYDIRLGVVRNVKKFDYEAAGLAIGEKPSTLYKFLTNHPGRSATEFIPPEPKTVDLAEADIENLRLMKRVNHAHRSRRQSISGRVFEYTATQLSLDDGVGNIIPPPIDEKIRRYRGDVRTEYSVRSQNSSIVSECMTLAGAVCSKWLKKHKVHAPFRGCALDHTDAEKEAADIVKSCGDENLPSKSVVLPLFPSPVSSALSHTPVAHDGLGLADGYIKCTSPLRRYADLVAHWQICSKLKELHTGESDPDIWGADEIKQLNEHIQAEERRYNLAQSNIERRWIVRLMHELLLDNKIPNEFEILIMSSEEFPKYLVATLKDYDVYGQQIRYMNPERDITKGSTWRAKWMVTGGNTGMTRPYVYRGDSPALSSIRLVIDSQENLVETVDQARDRLMNQMRELKQQRELTLQLSTPQSLHEGETESQAIAAV